MTTPVNHISLCFSQGKIQIPGISEHVLPVTDAERALYGPIDFDPESFRQDSGATGKLRFSTKEDILMHRWRFPSLSIHGVEGAWSGPGGKTVYVM